MKTVATIMLLLIVSVLVCGCLSDQDQMILNAHGRKLDMLYDSFKEYDRLALDTRAKWDAGTLTGAEAKLILDKIGSDVRDAKEEAKSIENDIRDMKGSGASTADILYGLLTVAASFFGVNLYRNRKHPLTTELNGK